MPQSYDFIIKPARDFREKFLKKLEIAFFMWQDKSLYATMNRWRIDPSYFPVSLIFPQPARTYRLGEFHEMLWSQQRLKLRGIEAGTGFLHARQIAVTQNGLDARKLTVKTEDEKLHRLLLGWRADIRNATAPECTGDCSGYRCNAPQSYQSFS